VALAEHAARFPDLVPFALETDHLDARDAAFAHAIYDAVLRRWVTMTYLLDIALKQPMRTLQPALQGVLLSGAAQLLLLDRVPVHAALNESVELAKALVSRGAGGLVNAVLRRVAQMRAAERDPQGWNDRRDRLPQSDGASVPLSDQLLPAEQFERLVVATSHSDWLLNRWTAEHGDHLRSLALHSLSQPPVILNTHYAQASLPPALGDHQQPGSHVYSGSHADLRSLLQSRDDLWVQDPASSLAIAAAAHLTPKLVVDACAGQGTKTRQLAAAFPEAEVIATDIDESRFRILEGTYRGHPRVRVVPHSSLREFAGRADLVLLDVPCGNSGVLARRPEAKYRASNSQLKRLTAIQRQIIADSIPLLRSAPRGKILYSTCSIDTQENQDMVAWAVKWHRFSVEHELLTLPSGLPGECASAYSDGSFSALLG
jgi:16S rRNA (cytosine967-C5)-methyltransferase